MSAQLSLKVEPRAEELENVNAAVADFAAAEKWPPDFVFRVHLVLEELSLNIMKHGKDENLHEIKITMTSEADVLTIEIVDDGQPFNPLKDAPQPDLEATIKDRPVGGLGIHLVRTMMDELHYRREQGRNHLTLVKGRIH